MPNPRQSLQSLSLSVEEVGFRGDLKGRNLSQKAMNAPMTPSHKPLDDREFAPAGVRRVWQHTCLKSKVRRVSIL
jgi:hypothetical protein